MRAFSKKTRIALVSAVAVAVTGGGVAYGYWSTNGTATGSANNTAGAASLTITQTSVLASLAPGLPAGNITGTVTNNADHKSYVHKVTVSISSITQADAAVGTCSAADYTLSNPDMLVDEDLAKNVSANFSGATLAFNDTASNQDGCKGATVNLAYAAS